MPHPTRLVLLPLTAMLLAGATLAQGVPATAAQKPQEAASCIAAVRGPGHNQHVITDGRHLAEWKSGGCEVEVRFEGELRFDEDFTDLIGLERRGRFEVREKGPVDRELEVRQEDGGLRFTYEVDGRRRELDAEGQAWLRSAVLQLFRRTGYAAQQRVAWLLRRAGPEGVLAELEQMESGYAQQLYVTALLHEGPGPRVVARVLRVAGTWESDHAKAEALEAVSARLGDDAAARREAWAVARTLESDHYAAQALGHLLDAGRPGPADLEAALQVVEGMDSDHYRAEALKGLADQPALPGAQVSRFLHEVGRMGSDHYRAEALSALVKRERLEDAELVEAIRVAARTASPHYRASMLVRIAERHALKGAAREAYRAAANAIESDHYRKEALAALE